MAELVAVLFSVHVIYVAELVAVLFSVHVIYVAELVAVHVLFLFLANVYNLLDYCLEKIGLVL